MQGCVSQNGYILLEHVPENAKTGTYHQERVPENAKMGTYHLERVPENAKTGTYYLERRARTFEKSDAAKEKSTRQNSLLIKWEKLSEKWASSFRLTRARVRAYQGFCTFCFHNLHTRGVESRSSEINIKELQQKKSDIFW